MNNISLIGFSTKTNNLNELTEAKLIPSIMQKFFNYQNQLNEDQKANQFFAVYTDYQLDNRQQFDIEKGYYTYFFGCLSENITIDQEKIGLKLLKIPNQNYQKLESHQGEFPNVIIDLWQKIWLDKTLYIKRNFIADFELYETKNFEDPKKSQVNIFIGVK